MRRCKQMKLQEEIAKVAYELYEKSGCINGKDSENWLEAEMIVLLRHAGQDRPVKQAVTKEKKVSPKKKGRKSRENVSLS
jgi:hypothetical protein